MTLQALTHPSDPSSFATHLKEGYIIGPILGEVSSVDDPEKIGRIKARCPLIKPGIDLPSGLDGWIPFVTPYATNATAGGTLGLVEVGTQVALFPVGGKGTFWIAFQCIYSRVDRPHPELDRANKVHGTVTAGEVYHVNNDKDQSRIEAYPHGVVEMVDARGDRLTQTAGGARTHLRKEGDVRMENLHSFTHVTAAGDVIQKSKSGAMSLLNQNGEATVSSGFQAALKLLRTESKVTGPLNPIAQLLKDAQSSLSGHIGKGQGLLKELEAKLGGLNIKGLGGVESAIADASKLLAKLEQGLATELPKGLKALESVSRLSPSALGETLLPQAQKVLDLNLHQLVPSLEKLIAQKLPGADLLQQAAKLIAKPIEHLEKIAPILDSLSHDPTIQLQSLLDTLIPDSFEQVKNLAGLDLLKTIAPVQAIFSLPALEDVRLSSQDSFLENQALEQEWQKILQRRTQDLHQLLPEPLQKIVSQDFISELLQLPNTSTATPMQLLLGKVQQGIAESSRQAIKSAEPLTSAIGPVKNLIESLKSGNVDPSQLAALSQLPGFSGLKGVDPKHLEEVLKQAITPLTARLRPLLEAGAKQVNQLINSIPSAMEGAVLRLTPLVGELQAMSMGASGMVRVSKGAGEVIGPGGINRIFAGVKSAGIRTPHGSFGFGAGGGSLFSKGAMSLLSGAAGVLMDGKGGISLSSLSGVGMKGTGDDEQVVWNREHARVIAKGDTVRLQSLGSAGAVAHEIAVTPEGVFINGYEIVSRFNYFDEQILSLRSTVESLAASLAALSPVP